MLLRLSGVVETRVICCSLVRGAVGVSVGARREVPSLVTTVRRLTLLRGAIVQDVLQLVGVHKVRCLLHAAHLALLTRQVR